MYLRGLNLLILLLFKIVCERSKDNQTKSNTNAMGMTKGRGKKCTILQTFSQQNGFCCVSALLKRNNYLDVAVVNPAFVQPEPLLINELVKQRDFSVKWFVFEVRMTVMPGNAMMLEDVNRLDDVAVIIVKRFNSTRNDMFLKQKSLAVIVSLETIVRNLNNYEVTYPLIKSLFKLQKLAVQTLLLQMPLANKVKNPSEWEQIICRKRGMEVLKRDFDKYFPIAGLGEKYKIRELFTNGSLRDGGNIRYKDYYVRNDRKSKYVNVLNHIRAAVDLPANATNYIHIVGDSTSMGGGVMDEDTIASYLQGMINKKNGKEASFSALIHAAAGIDLIHIHRRLRDISINKGDIVIVVVRGPMKRDRPFSEEFMKSCKENGVLVFRSQSEYNRPHDMGEVFIDRTHPNSNGNRKTAEILYFKLFVDSNKFHVPEKFKHYFGGMDIERTEVFEAKDELTYKVDFLVFVRNLERDRDGSQNVGVAVMNCNPFTLGHLYLIEIAASNADILRVFIVEEEKSQFMFTDRFELVSLGTLHIHNIKILPSSQFIISGFTFPEYFVKGENTDALVDPSLDLDIFCKWIAPALGVQIRFVGEEPLDRVTLQYNKGMMNIVPRFGIKMLIVPRREARGIPVSASHVRNLLGKNDFVEISSIVPITTFEFLRDRFLVKNSQAMHIRRPGGIMR